MLGIEIVGATPACKRAYVEARAHAAQVIEAQLQRYEYWARRSPLQRRVASLSPMAAIAEPISELVAEDRLTKWKTLVEPVTEFVGRGLISPND